LHEELFYEFNWNKTFGYRTAKQKYLKDDRFIDAAQYSIIRKDYFNTI